MSQFNYWVEIVRATKKDDGLYIEGEASNTKLDAYETIFTERCQEGFVADIGRAVEDGKPLQVEVEHEGDVAPVFNIGAIIEGQLDQSRTRIVAKLDPANPLANYYYTILTSTAEENRAMGRPSELGFSIRGSVEESRRDYSDEAQKYVVHYDRVKLRKVGLTEKPANYECYAEAIKRSINDTIKRDEMPEQEKEVETTEVVTEVVVDEVVVEDTTNAAEEETTEADPANEQTEVGSVEISEEKGQEEVKPVVEEVTSGETAVETSTEEQRSEASNEVGKEITRGVISDSMAADEMAEEIREVTYTFESMMWRALYCGEPMQAAGAIKELAAEYAELIGGITTSRTLDTSDAALQKEDVSDEISYGNSIRSELAKRNKKNVVETIERSVKENEQITELTRSVEDLKAELTQLKTEKEELAKRNEELLKQPASNPANPLVQKEDVFRKQLDELKRKGNKQEIAKLILANANIIN